MRQHIKKWCIAAWLVGAAATVAGCGVARGEAAGPGAVLYESCDSCHGTGGAGDASLGAPRIAGLPKWYVASQVERFQNGLRGKHFDDVEGLRMRAMAKQMMSKAEIDAVAAHVAALPVVISAPSLTVTNRPAAEGTFAACASCHGQKGEGTEALNAPPLAGLDDWYLARQLRKFQSGVRGTGKSNSGEVDTLGAQMSAMSQAVPPPDVDNMAAFLHGLK